MGIGDLGELMPQLTFIPAISSAGSKSRRVSERETSETETQRQRKPEGRIETYRRNTGRGKRDR